MEGKRDRNTGKVKMKERERILEGDKRKIDKRAENLIFSVFPTNKFVQFP